jgi:hypothetical protein
LLFYIKPKVIIFLVIGLIALFGYSRYLDILDMILHILCRFGIIFIDNSPSRQSHSILGSLVNLDNADILDIVDIFKEIVNNFHVILSRPILLIFNLHKSQSHF